jgi:hypothetical protein
MPADFALVTSSKPPDRAFPFFAPGSGGGTSMYFPNLAWRMWSLWSDAVFGTAAAANGASSGNGAAAKSAPGNGSAPKAPATPSTELAPLTPLNGLTPLAPLTGLSQLAPSTWLAGQAWDYWYDRVQRTWLVLDVLRERGNAKLEHEEQGKPALLTFEYETVLDGRNLDRPANYALLRIKPRPGTVTDAKKRPYVIVDPRAGHGPGVGGFKEDSQIGMALRAGHPCYFLTFYPEPVKGQTIADVHHVETVFMRKVRELHPDANKPVVIGNCQAGWAVAILCAGAPEVFGPIVLAGAPLSYWAGVDGDGPLRFAGGLTGGTWMATLAGDLGNGRFDGANLVANFENLNPGNTLWSKTYNLFRKIDTEAERYLQFERWWGGFFFVNTEEMRFIANELFVGNKLAQGTLTQQAGEDPVDLRNIRSPIVVFCSWGDNITPPYQALHWILDVYPTDEDILANEQTIIYMLHDTIGHLGIFVSGEVARKEHAEVIRTLEMVEMLPPGLYEMSIRDREAGHPDDELIAHRYRVTFEERKLDDIRKMGGVLKDEKLFETAAKVSEFNESLYRSFVSPWIRMWTNEATAELTRNLHPGRVRQYIFSDRINPAMASVEYIADEVRKQRRPVAGDNVFVALEQTLSDGIVAGLDLYRDLRDQRQERMFKALYGNPFVQAAFGAGKSSAEHSEEAERREEADRRARMAERIEALKARDLEGGTLEAFVRICAYIHKGQPAAEERGFRALKQIHDELHEGASETLVQFKDAVREQTFLVRLDEERALETLPLLLRDDEHRIATMHAVRRLEKAMGPVDAEHEARIRRVEEILAVPRTLDEPVPVPEA